MSVRPGRQAVVEKFDRLAVGYSARDYADPNGYARHRAEVALALGPALPRQASVLDLGCGDGNMAAPFLERGLAYHGIDASSGMVAEARRRFPGARFDVADLERYEPPEPVDLTLCLRVLPYVSDRRRFFRAVGRYTRTKLAFDFNPRVQSRKEIEADLAAAGFADVRMRPFLLPQLLAVPGPIRRSLLGLEHVPVASAFALHVRGIWFCAASHGIQH